MNEAQREYIDLHRQVRDLEYRVRTLEEALGQVAEIDYGAPYSSNEQCRTHTCDYYAFYQAQGPAELTHEGFHAAQRQLKAAYEAQDTWLKENEGNAKQLPDFFEARCSRLERLVRA